MPQPIVPHAFVIPQLPKPVYRILTDVRQRLADAQGPASQWEVVCVALLRLQKAIASVEGAVNGAHIIEDALREDLAEVQRLISR